MADLDDDNPQKREALINRIDELENLLAQKKSESTNTNSPRLKVGTDGIPVLMETVDETNQDITTQVGAESAKQNDALVNEIIDKVDKEISQDLDELIVLLKDSIIDEVKIRLLKELTENKTKTE